MSKAARAARRNEPSKIRVDDAVALIDGARELARIAALPPSAHVTRSYQWTGEVSRALLTGWDRSRVVLRVDADFLDALLATPRDVKLVPDWLERFPYDTVAVSLAEPFDIDEGQRVCRYRGFVASGYRSNKGTGGVDFPAVSDVFTQSAAWTTYGPISEGDGVRFLWIFEDLSTGMVGGQTVSPMFRSDASDVGIAPLTTIEGLVASVAAVYEGVGGTPGADAEFLVPASVLLLLYLTATEPDLDEIPAARLVRPQQISQTTVTNVGWRVGSALRRWRSDTTGEPGAHTGRKLPPHIRAAHFHRFRVATRDSHGVIIGNIQGERGTDWHYELRWIAPTPVNVGDDGPTPTVRSVQRDPT